jgi:hypothetical protein
MNSIANSTFNQIAAHDFARTHNRVQARDAAVNLRTQVDVAARHVNELNRLDRKWNGGFATGETVGAREQLGALEQREDVLRTYFKDQMTSNDTFPSQKEYAEKSLRRLDGKLG